MTSVDNLDNSDISDQSRRIVKGLYPGIQPIAFRILQDVKKVSGKSLNVVQGIRSMSTQLSLYSQGRKLVDGRWIIVDPGKIVTNARPGMSYHCYGLAFDVAWAGQDPYLQKLTKEEQTAFWADYGKMVNANGMHWGGDFKLSNGAHDLPHAELAYGLTIVDCLELYERGGIQTVWKHIDQTRGMINGLDDYSRMGSGDSISHS